MKNAIIALVALGSFLASARGMTNLLEGLETSYKDAGLVSSHTVRVSGVTAPVHYLQSGSDAADHTVILLHGAAFDARTWQVVGTLDALAHVSRLRTIAIDLPGYGKHLSGSIKQSADERMGFVASFLEALGSSLKYPPVVIAASMGGTYGAPFVLAHQTAGYISVSALLDAPEQASKTPALLVWGELDSPESEKAHLHERIFPNHAKVVLPNAPHPAYLLHPGLFNDLVLQFIHAPRTCETGKSCADNITVHSSWGRREGLMRLMGKHNDPELRS